MRLLVVPQGWLSPGLARIQWLYWIVRERLGSLFSFLISVGLSQVSPHLEWCGLLVSCILLLICLGMALEFCWIRKSLCESKRPVSNIVCFETDQPYGTEGNILKTLKITFIEKTLYFLLLNVYSVLPVCFWVKVPVSVCLSLFVSTSHYVSLCFCLSLSLSFHPSLLHSLILSSITSILSPSPLPSMCPSLPLCILSLSFSLH